MDCRYNLHYQLLTKLRSPLCQTVLNYMVFYIWSNITFCIRLAQTIEKISRRTHLDPLCLEHGIKYVYGSSSLNMHTLFTL